MAASIKRNETEEAGAREFPGVTAGKSYAVQGYTGGGAVIVNDSGKFVHVGFADLDSCWSVTDETAKAAKKADAQSKAADKAAAAERAEAASETKSETTA